VCLICLFTCLFLVDLSVSGYTTSQGGSTVNELDWMCKEMIVTCFRLVARGTENLP
jgi:hypothetical protein